MTRADHERILRRWGWTPERIAALSDERIAFIAVDVPRDKAFVTAALAAVPPPKVSPSAGPSPKVTRALAEIRRAALGEKRVTAPIGAEALAAALATIERIGHGRS